MEVNFLLLWSIWTTAEFRCDEINAIPYFWCTRGLFSRRRSHAIEEGLSFSNLLLILFFYPKENLLCCFYSYSKPYWRLTVQKTGIKCWAFSHAEKKPPYWNGNGCYHNVSRQLKLRVWLANSLLCNSLFDNWEASSRIPIKKRWLNWSECQK